MAKAFYASKFSPNLSRTPEGFLLAQNVPFARTGYQDYLPDEIGVDGSGIIKVFRSPDEIFDKKTMASFEGKPVTDDHPANGVSPSDAQFHVRGVAQNIRRGTGENDDLLLGDLIIYDQRLIDEIMNGKREVSAGYECEYHPMNEEGTKYAQRNIVGNHIAVVDRGRAGSRVRINDNEAKEVKTTITSDAPCDQYKNEDGTFKGGFDGAVKYFMCQGKSEEEAKAIAGKIAKEKGDDSAPRRKGKDRMAKRLPKQKTHRVSDFLTAIGLKNFAMDAEPEDIMEAVDGLVDEREDDDAEKATPEKETSDSPETNDQIEAIQKQLEELKDIIRGMTEKTKDAEDPIEKAIKDLEAHPVGEEEKNHEEDPVLITDEDGFVAPKEERPRDGLSTVDRAFKIEALKAIKPAVASIADPVARQKASDAMVRAVMGAPSRNLYSEISKSTKKAAKDNAQKQPEIDFTNLGMEWAKQRNPHYKSK